MKSPIKLPKVTRLTPKLTLASVMRPAKSPAAPKAPNTKKI